MKFLMYGAGSIGRGFIGPLFARAGYEVVFVDVNTKIVNALNSRKSYYYTVAAQPPYNVPVSGVRGVDGLDEQAVTDEIASCDLMAASLGADELLNVAPLIAKGFSRRMRQSGQPLNLIICENLRDAAQLLRDCLLKALPERDKPLLIERCGLIESAIGRMVPVAVRNDDDPLHITVEEYGFLPVDRDAFIGEPPGVDGLIPHSPFEFYTGRKLYLHNMGHAVCAYLGMIRGYDTIAQAVSDPVVRLLTQSAMTEAAAMLSVKHTMPFSQIFDHAEDLLLRFANTSLGDTCERVGRDPKRKIAAGDRLAGAICQCLRYGVHPVYISLGYAAALRSLTGDAEAAANTARETGKLTQEQISLVIRLFAALELPPEELLRTVEEVKKENRGNTV